MRVQFTGWQSPVNVAKWYEAADILVAPSRYEPFGMVMLEGMLYGLAVLAADVGGPSEILEHGRTGLLFPACDVQALSSALLWLIEHPVERQTLGRPRTESANSGCGREKSRRCSASAKSSHLRAPAGLVAMARRASASQSTPIDGLPGTQFRRARC
jgi:glycosyltransferase involved in cell wall biosynthesis